MAWALAGEGDLNANLVAFDPGGGVGEHVNAELDVLFVGVRGRGEVRVDGRALALGPGDLLLVPRGARRGTRATEAPFAYLTVHRRRPGLHLGLPPRS